MASYDYDVLGSLRRVNYAGGLDIEYIIDGLGRRIGKKVNGALEQGWLYQDQLNPVAELDAIGNVVARFVYGAQGHVPDFMEKGGIIYRYITDHLGSVRMVVDTSVGSVVQELRYDEFGQVLMDTNPSFQPFGFAGGLYDADTGLVRFGARDYDASVGRWTAKDPILFEGGQANLYVYAGNDPANYLDPDGQIVVTAAVVGGITLVELGVYATAGAVLGAAAAYFDGAIQTAIDYYFPSRRKGERKYDRRNPNPDKKKCRDPQTGKKLPPKPEPKPNTYGDPEVIPKGKGSNNR